jgi:hypothetical protein
MPQRSARPGLHTFVFFLALASLLVGSGSELAQAQSPIFNEVHTIAGPTVAVPQEFTFTASKPGNYTITLTDTGALLTPAQGGPAPLQMAQLAVTNSSAVVGTPLVLAGATGMLTLTSLPKGDYVIHVIGLPSNIPGSGFFTIQVQDPDMTQIDAFGGVLALPSGALPNGVTAVSPKPFQFSGATGCYSVTLTDMSLPAALSQVGLLLVQQGGANPLTFSSPGQQTTTLTSGATYSIIAYAVPDATVNAGLFSIVIAPSPPGTPPDACAPAPVAVGTAVYGFAVPVGNTISLGSPGLAAGPATFTLTDLKSPAALTQLQAVVMLNGQPAFPAPLSSPGSQMSQGFTAVTGTYQAFAAGIPASAAPGTGTYAVQLTQGGTTLLGVARGVTAPGSAVTAYSFDTNVSAANAGPSTLSLTDFQFPAALTSLGLTAVQSGARLGTALTAAGNINIKPAAGPLSFLVFAQAAPGGGLFGIDVKPLAGGGSTFGVTQGVGAAFSASQFSVTTAGTYAVTATDLGFPAAFANFDTIVTQGTTLVGQIFGGGTFVINATPGEYFINFIAQPTGTDQAGTFALNVGSAPPEPVVNLSTDNSSVSSGSTVDIIWSTKNATSCTASGGWSGSQALSGTTTSAVLTANTTFTLSCTGTGGTTSKSVSVTVTAPSGGGGHGGAIDAELLALLGLLLAWRAAGLSGLSPRAHSVCARSRAPRGSARKYH